MGSISLGGDDTLIYTALENGKFNMLWTINGKQFNKTVNNVKELKERAAKLAYELATVRNT